MINKDVTNLLDELILMNSIEADNILDDYLHSDIEDESQLTKVNVVKACSEALSIAVAKCFCPEQVYEGFK